METPLPKYQVPSTKYRGSSARRADEPLLLLDSKESDLFER